MSTSRSRTLEMRASTLARTRFLASARFGASAKTFSSLLWSSSMTAVAASGLIPSAHNTMASTLRSASSATAFRASPSLLTSRGILPIIPELPRAAIPRPEVKSSAPLSLPARCSSRNWTARPSESPPASTAPTP